MRFPADTFAILFAALAMLLYSGGCQYVAGSDAKGNSFTAVGVFTTPEVAKARVGGMSVEGYKRGIDAEAMSAVVGAAVKAAVKP